MKRERHSPSSEGRHEKFQFGTNPMAMTGFEKELVAKEQMERHLARENYIIGIQGRDGGHWKHESVVRNDDVNKIEEREKD